MADQPMQPMIGKENRPSPIDFNAALSSLNVGQYLALSWGEWLKVEKEISKELHKVEKEHIKEKETHLKETKQEHLKPEQLKPEYFKPEHFKPELYKPEYFKPEWVKGGEQIKVEKEVIKELVKPEGLKGEKEFKPDPGLDRLVEQIAERVVEILRQRGITK